MRGSALLWGTAFTFCLVGCSDQSISTPSDASSGPSLIPVLGALRPGRVQTVVDLRPLIDMPEGIALDQSGNIFISNRRNSSNRVNPDLRVCEILQISPDHTVSVLATLDPGARNSATSGTTGLAVGPHGEVYAALVSFHPGTHGVWRIRRNGEAERLAASEKMLFPNALAFDAVGNLYVTDSQGGAVWRFPPQGAGKLWIRHELLAPLFALGANGIAFVAPNHLFVANTDRTLIARIPIEPGGGPGKPKVVAKSPELLTIDGLAADAHGDLHAVIVLAAVFGVAPLVRVNPETGEISAETAEVNRFDFPTSLAFRPGSQDPSSVYVVNSGIFPEGRPEAAPGVVRVGLDLNGD